MTNLAQQLTNTVKHWYIPLIIGILFIALGAYIFTVPNETYFTLSVLFSISFVVSGIFEIVFSVQNKEVLKGWGWYLIGGLLTLLMGIYLQIYPGISEAILPFYVGFTMLFRSFQLLGYSFDLQDIKHSKWGTLAFISVLGIILSFLLLANPQFTSLSIVTLTAVLFIFVGVASSVFAFSLKDIKNEIQN